VKISPPSSAPGLAYESDLLPTEADYYRLTRPLGVPVPEVFAVGSDVIPGRQHLVMSTIPGQTWWELEPAPSPAVRASLRRALGRFVALAHQASCDGFGYMFGREHLRGTTWPDAFERMIGALLDDACQFGTQLPVSPDEIREMVTGHRTALSEVERPVVVHFDLWDGNVLVNGDETGHVITGIIDAERAFHGDPLFELPSLTVFSSQAKDPNFIVDYDFLTGYSEVHGPLEITQSITVRLALYRVYLYMVMLIEITPRQMTGTQVSWRQTEVFDIVRQQLRYLQSQLR
jgi:aminoglycoside phosphotransferase (APT) family kinase protein